MSRIQGSVSGRRRLAEIPRYRWIQFTILAVLAVAFVTSFQSGSAGADQSGYRPEFSMAFPLICDVVAMLATVVHGWARHDVKMRRTAVWFVLGPMGLSWVANAVDHWRDAGVVLSQLVTIGQWLWAIWVAVAAGLCPVAVAALLYFATKFIEFEQRTATKPTTESTVETAETTPETEPEFVEPAARIPTLTVPPAALETASEVDAETTPGIDEIEVHRVMRDTKPRVSREAAVVMVRDKCSRATAYRRVQKEAGDAAALA